MSDLVILSSFWDITYLKRSNANSILARILESIVCEFCCSTSKSKSKSLFEAFSSFLFDLHFLFLAISFCFRMASLGATSRNPRCLVISAKACIPILGWFPRRSSVLRAIFLMCLLILDQVVHAPALNVMSQKGHLESLGIERFSSIIVGVGAKCIRSGKKHLKVSYKLLDWLKVSHTEQTCLILKPDYHSKMSYM